MAHALLHGMHALKRSALAEPTSLGRINELHIHVFHGFLLLLSKAAEQLTDGSCTSSWHACTEKCPS